MIALKIENLSKNFGRTEVLKKINLEINDGNFLVLLGPSGCGKSTLLNIVAGLESIDEGAVFIDDYNVSNVEPKDRNIAMVFQSYALYPSMNVKENITFGLKQSKTPKNKIEEQLKKVSTFLQVDELLNRKPSQLSGGQRQRIAIARALYVDPKILILDECTNSLDLKTEKQIIDEVNSLKGKKTIIMIAHRLSTLENCDRIYKIDNEGLELEKS